jgi:hypothetical protein
MRKNKSEKKKKKKIAIVLIIVAVLLLAFGAYKITHKGKSEPVNEVKKEDEIQTKEFIYTLYDNKSDLYKEYFKKLKEELTKDQINEEEYAKIISELFAIDFYSLEDKRTSTDVGGLDFIYEDMKDNFVLKATDTIYKYVESNVYGDRKQELPKVKAVEIKSAEKKLVNIKDVKDENGYVIVVKIDYEKTSKFPKEITLSLVHKDTKLYILEVK